ncbi:MAG: hypothetical protein ACRDHB_09720 [Actinomycetota bacterium]
MSQPIVFISRHRVKPGKLEELTSLTREIWSTMEAEKPRTLMNLAYVNEQGTEVTSMHAFADPEAMAMHWEGADERAALAYQYVEPMGFEIYGSPGEQIVEGMRVEAAAGGATLTLVPEFVTGFLRLIPG